MMRFLAGLIVAVGTIVAATVCTDALECERLNETRALSEAEMGALLTTMLTGRAGVGDLRIENGDIVFRAAGRDVRMGLVPLSAQFNALPDARSRQTAYDDLAQRIAEVIVGPPAKSESEVARFRATLLPVLKNRSYVEQFATQARKQGAPHARLLHLSLAGDIIVAAASDLPTITRFLAVGEGGAYGMSDGDVLRAALDNWIRRVDKIEIHDFGLVRAFHVGEGDYNASILLLPNPWETVPDLPRNVAIGVPSRNVLAFADADDVRAVAALRALTKPPDKRFPVSRQIYKLTAKGLVVIP